jgi:NAD-dependent DNA ligase
MTLFEKVVLMLEDGVLDEEESSELFIILRKLSGDASEIGELAKPSTLPLDTPTPDIKFDNKLFLFTGTFAFGNRNQCKEVTESLGGLCAKGVTKSLNYLVLGTYVTDSLAHENFGRKIEKAMEYRSKGIPLALITAEHWAFSENINQNQ